MIARHSHEQSESGEGVEVVVNTACEDEIHGKGQYTEKRIHLSRLSSLDKNYLIYYIFINSNLFFYLISDYFFSSILSCVCAL